MITLENALAIILEETRQMPVETVDFGQSFDRVLAEDVLSDMAMPPFDKSAVDGYAFRMEDSDQELVIIEAIQAGKKPGKTIGPGQCSKIMTGAEVPAGATFVVMAEDTEKTGDKIRILRKPGKTNICLLGEDFGKGEKVVMKGTTIGPQHIAIMAAVGWVQPKVFSRPDVSVIVTGDEIVEPYQKPGISMIRNSNGYQLTAQLIKSGCIPHYRGIVKDDEYFLNQAIESALRKSGILILTGGASKGDYDLVPPVLEKLGFDIRFTEVAIQPGKPVSFAVKDNKVCFGLSGNPVSSFFQFELLVKPFLRRITGIEKPGEYLKLQLGKEITRKKTAREYFFPVTYRDTEAIPVDFHGSAHINALACADGIASMSVGIAELKKGDYVNVRQI